MAEHADSAMAQREQPPPPPPPPQQQQRQPPPPRPMMGRREYIEMMHHRAMHQVNGVLDVCLNSSRSAEKWSCLKRDKHLELYAKKSNTSRSVFFLGVNEIRCSFDEVYELLNYDTTAKFRLMMKLVYEGNFRDGAVLHTHAQRPWDEDYDVAEVQHAAVWFTLQDRRESMIGKDNLLSFFQALMVLHPDRGTMLSTATAATGIAAFARPSDSVKKRTLALAWVPFCRTPGMPDVADAALRLQYTLIVEEVSRHRLRLSCVTASFRDGDDLQSHKSARQIARRLVARSVSKLDGAVLAARISRQTVVSQHQWVRNEDRASCVICWKAFSFYRRRHHCRLCGEVICGACSTLRNTNVIVRQRQFERLRICHLCSNRHRLRVDSFASTSTTSQQAPALTIEDELDGTTATTTTMGAARPRIQIVDPHAANFARLETTDEDMDEGDEEDDYDGGGGGGGHHHLTNDGYLGDFFPPLGATSSQKIISLRSMTRAELLARSTSTTIGASMHSWRQSSGSSAASSMTPSSPPAPPHAFRRLNTVPGAQHPPTGPTGVTRRRHWESLSFLHPAAAAPASQNEAEPPTSIVADVGSLEGAIFWSETKVPSHERASMAIDSLEKKIVHEEATREYRRTSMLSLGLIDSFNTAHNNSLLDSGPRVDSDRERQRIKLMKVVCSPACTLVDRALMADCCEMARAAFGVQGAFIARVEDAYVVMEHAIGTTRLSAIDHFLRSETPCDFVIAQPDQIFCVADCSRDPRTQGIVLVKELGLRFFVGVSIVVRGLPIACLCAFSQVAGAEDDEDRDGNASTVIIGSNGSSSTSDGEHVTVTQYELNVLGTAASRIEHELGRLVHGLAIN